MIKSYINLFFCVITNFIFQIIFGELAINFNNLEISLVEIEKVLSGLLITPMFWIALIMFMLSALFWISGIKKIALSEAFSFLSLNYLLILGYSSFFLNEEITLKNSVACIMIVLGAIVLAQNNKLNSR